MATHVRSRKSWLALVVLVLVACDDEPAAPDAGRRPTDAAASRDAGSREAGGGPADARVPDARAIDARAEDAGEPECAPAGIEIAETCPPFVACGGALTEGVRCYETPCVEHDELLGPMLPYCAGIVVESATGTIRGRASLREGQLARTSTTAMDLTIRFPALCVVNGCDEVETLTRAQLGRFTTVTCAMSDACRCELELRESIEETAPYSADPSRGALVIGSGDDAREHLYCASGDGALLLVGPSVLGAQSLAPPR